MSVLAKDLAQVAAGSKDVCLEDTVGDLFRKMVFTDALVYTIVTLMTFVMIKTVRNGQKIEYAERSQHCCSHQLNALKLAIDVCVLT